MPKRENRPTLSAYRMACIFREMQSLRRIYCEDTQFFKMIDVWEWLTDDDEGSGEIRIKKYKSSNSTQRTKAGVVALGDKATLVVSEEMISKAKNGGKFENFTLAHEYSHLALDHHAMGAVVKNFQLYNSDSGLANIPPTIEELEANFAATFFQCGTALLDSNVDPVSLANRAYTDVYYVKKAVRMLRIPAFRQELSKQESSIVHVVL